MKFLEDAKLAQLTADLTDATLVGCHGGGSHHGHHEGGGAGTSQPISRILNGRIEAYTTKRVSSDKKYAHALGEKYIREIDQVEEEMAQFHRSLGLGGEDAASAGGSGEGGVSAGGGRRRAGSIDEWKRNAFGVNKQAAETAAARSRKAEAEEKKSSTTTTKDESRDSSTSPKLTGKSGPGGSRAGRKPDKADEPAKGSRRRSKSVDIGGVAKATAQASTSARVTISTEPTEPTTGRPSSSSSKGGGGGEQQTPLTSIMKPSRGGGGGGGGRHRSSSFDTSRDATALHSHGYFSNSSLGDFHEMGTRRLMTDLILTLNASFPDYDFGSVRPDHFVRLPGATAAVNRVNERLSEFAATLPANAHGYGRSMMDGAGFSGYGYGASSSRDDGGVFLQRLWGSIDDVIVLNDCEVYSYVPPAGDNDDDPLGFLTETLAPGGGGGGGAGGGTTTSNGPASASATVAATATNVSAATGHMGSAAPGPLSGAAAAQSAVAEAQGNVDNAGVGASMPLWTFNYFFVNKSLKRIVLFACVQTMQNESMDIDDDDMMDDVRSGRQAIGIPSPSSRMAASPDAATPTRYGYDDVDDVDNSPPTGFSRGADGGTRRMTDGGGVSGYYSVSSTDARTDDEYDAFDTGALAQDVSRPATPGTPVGVS